MAYAEGGLGYSQNGWRDKYKIKKTKADSHLKSISKGITWRIIATLITITIALLITGKLNFALKIGALEFFFKILVYYLDERLWQIIPSGIVSMLKGFNPVKRKDLNF